MNPRNILTSSMALESYGIPKNVRESLCSLFIVRKLPNEILVDGDLKNGWMWWTLVSIALIFRLKTENDGERKWVELG